MQDAATRAGTLPEAERKRIDRVVATGVERGDYPGAVVLVQRDRHTVFHEAYGSRSLVPERTAMQRDTVFDLASLTKPVATATAVLVLRDRGLLALSDPISKHLVGCGLSATIDELLTHRAGLPPANSLADYRTGRGGLVSAICATNQPRKRRERYSDVGYILLGELVAAVAGKPFDTFCEEAIFEPLAMKDTSFSPDAARRARSAPTFQRHGAVHDPRAAALGGVAGHAGLFSTAHDLARWADMILAGGQLGEKRVLSAASVKEMLRPRAKSRRTAGLVQSVVGGFAHTGFTGTSLWIEPSRQTALIILASRLHPKGKGDVKKLRQEVRAAVIAANRAQRVSLGVDVARADAFAALAGKRVGLITNATGRARDGVRTIDLLHQAPNVKLVALFSPEHGLAAQVDGAVADGRDVRTGVVIHSLYGKHQRPTPAQLANVDALVFDMQSIGARFYTYETTLGYALEAAARRSIPILVFDRPNPIGGTRVEGPVLEPTRRSFVGYHPVPVRHGMTIGELARLFNAERRIGAALTVVKLAGWKRAQTFVDTGLAWTDPSPNMKSPEAALLYPGLALLELTNVSVGRGTEAPFTTLSAPWLDADAIVAELEAAELPGVTFRAGKHAVHFSVTDPDALRSVRLGLALAVALNEHHAAAWQTKNLITLIGHRPTVRAILAGKSLDDVIAAHAADVAAFRKRREAYLLYE